MKKLILPLMILLLISIVGAVENECKGTITPKESPCWNLLSNSSGGLCTDINASFYNNGSTFLYSQMMVRYDPAHCNATFNLTDVGTHTIVYENKVAGFVDSGSIIIQQEEIRMISIIMGLFFIALTFVGLGLFNRIMALKILCWGMAFSQVLMTALILYANELNKDFTPVLRINYWITLIVLFALMMMLIIVITIRSLFPIVPIDGMSEEQTDYLQLIQDSPPPKWQDK